MWVGETGINGKKLHSQAQRLEPEQNGPGTGADTGRKNDEKPRTRVSRAILRDDSGYIRAKSRKLLWADKQDKLFTEIGRNPGRRPKSI